MSAVIFVGRPTQPHIVNAKNGSDRCDCEAIKSRNICPHVIAVAHSNGELQELTVKWEPNLSNLVQSSIAKAAGRKSGPKRNRFSRASEQRDVSRLQDPLRILMLLQKRNRLISDGFKVQKWPPVMAEETVFAIPWMTPPLWALWHDILWEASQGVPSKRISWLTFHTKAGECLFSPKAVSCGDEKLGWRKCWFSLSLRCWQSKSENKS